MSDSFALLFSSLLDSSVWIGQPHHVVRVWIAMILLKDEQGIVSQTVRGLARRACVTEAETLEALKVLQDPDPESRNPEHDGRRIEAVRGGWLLLNHKPYRSRQALELERTRKRDDARKRRDTPPPSATDRYEPLLSATESDRALPSVSVSESGSESGEGDAGEPPEVPELQVVAPIARLARFVPDGWLPKDQHRVRCQESRLPFEDVLKRFRQQEFQRSYSDWDKRFDLWIDEQKTKAETARFLAQASPRSSGIRPVSDLDTTSAACAYNATSEQRAYAAEHGLNISDAVARCRGSPRFARLSTAEQEREMTHRLQVWRRTGAFPDPNEPLPRMKPKEARA